MLCVYVHCTNDNNSNRAGALSNNSREETRNPRRDSEKTGRCHVYNALFSRSLFLRFESLLGNLVITLCNVTALLGIRWVWSSDLLGSESLLGLFSGNIGNCRNVTALFSRSDRRVAPRRQASGYSLQGGAVGGGCSGWG